MAEVIGLDFSPGSKHTQKVSSSWSAYHHQYPYGIVISDEHLAMLSGIAANRCATSIITGETGTGKEEIAKLLHRLRCERDGKIPFVAVNCATITESLCESILFGHRRGAFTGADASTNGYIAEANGGILFLDEIQTLPLTVQQKLLRVMNDGTFNRLGETSQQKSIFQLVAASTKDLDDEVDAGRFLLDLRSRMTGVEIRLVPLRERLDDIPALLARRLSEHEISLDNSLSLKLAAYLRRFQWRGNIRQLFKAIDTWILLAQVRGEPLSLENFPILRGMNNPPESPSPSNHELWDAVFSGRDLEGTMERIEALMIREAIGKARNIGEAAMALGLPRSTLDSKRRKYGITQ